MEKEFSLSRQVGIVASCDIAKVLFLPMYGFPHVASHMLSGSTIHIAGIKIRNKMKKKRCGNLGIKIR